MLIIIYDNTDRGVSLGGLMAFTYDPRRRWAHHNTIMTREKCAKFQPHTMWQLELVPSSYQCSYPTTNIPFVDSAHQNGLQSFRTTFPRYTRLIAKSGQNRATFVSGSLRCHLDFINAPTLRHASLEGYAWVLYEILEHLVGGIMFVRIATVGWWVPLSKF